MTNMLVASENAIYRQLIAAALIGWAGFYAFGIYMFPPSDTLTPILIIFPHYGCVLMSLMVCMQPKCCTSQGCCTQRTCCGQQICTETDDREGFVSLAVTNVVYVCAGLYCLVYICFNPQLEGLKLFYVITLWGHVAFSSAIILVVTVLALYRCRYTPIQRV